MAEVTMKDWIEALQSGDYEQGQGSLCQRAGDGEGTVKRRYCCLGVLCDLVDSESWEDMEYYSRWGPEADIYMPSGNLHEELGLDWGDFSTLANMNDDGKSFEEIAAWLKEKFNEQVE